VKTVKKKSLVVGLLERGSALISAAMHGIMKYVETFLKRRKKEKVLVPTQVQLSAVLVPMEDVPVETRLESGHYVWEKGKDIPFSLALVLDPVERKRKQSYFSSGEFSCKCSNRDCVEQKVSVELIDLLIKLREAVDAPITVTSGFRCTKHQAAIRGSGTKTAAGTSTHELGQAADVRSKDMVSLGREVEKLFNNIGTASNFIHVDIRPLKADGTKRRWPY
jgi:hypothetical protein